MGNENYVLRADAERLDSLSPGAGVFFANELTQYEAQVLMAKLPAKNGLRLFPVVSGLNPGASSYRRKIMAQHGQAEFAGDMSTNPPRVDVSAEYDNVDFETIWDCFVVSDQEILAGQMAAANGHTGLNLDLARGLAAREAIELKLNGIVWNGAPALGLYGVLTHPYVPRVHLANASTAAVDTVIADILAVWNAVANNSAEVEKPTRMLMASKLRNYLAGRRRTNTDLTLIGALAESMGIAVTEIIGVHELNAAGMGGGDVIIADSRSEMSMGHILSVPMKFNPAQRKGLTYETILTARSAGMMTSFPGSMVQAEFPNALP